jgi:hypothetical protein
MLRTEVVDDSELFLLFLLQLLRLLNLLNPRLLRALGLRAFPSTVTFPSKTK